MKQTNVTEGRAMPSEYESLSKPEEMARTIQSFLAGEQDQTTYVIL